MQSRRGTHTGSQNAALNGTTEIIWEAFRAFGSLCSAGARWGSVCTTLTWQAGPFTADCCPVLYCSVLSCLLSFNVLYGTAMYCPVLSCTVLYCLVPSTVVVQQFSTAGGVTHRSLPHRMHTCAGRALGGHRKGLQGTQHGTARHGTARHGTAQHSTARSHA
jgi:hypothetical protein